MARAAPWSSTPVSAITFSGRILASGRWSSLKPFGARCSTAWLAISRAWQRRLTRSLSSHFWFWVCRVLMSLSLSSYLVVRLELADVCVEFPKVFDRVVDDWAAKDADEKPHRAAETFALEIRKSQAGADFAQGLAYRGKIDGFCFQQPLDYQTVLIGIAHVSAP